MSLLLLFGAEASAIVAATAAITFTAPAATTLAKPVGVVLSPEPALLTLTAPTATIIHDVHPASAAFTLTAQTPALAIVGAVTLSPSPAILTLSAGSAAVSIDLTHVGITIGGVERSANVRTDSLTIDDVLNEQPNVCSFTLDGTKPAVGQEIVITLGATNNRIFGGNLADITELYEGQDRRLIAWQCRGVDYTRLLDRRKVHWTYPAISATDIIKHLIGDFTSGFSTTHVQPGLPAIEIALEWEDVSSALTRIMKLVGGSWYVDYSRDVHAFLQEVVDAPEDLTEANAQHFTGVQKSTDLSQVRTRVIVIGAGTRTIAPVAAGADLMPIEDATVFRTDGGLAKTGTARLTYTGAVPGGTGSTVRGSDAPTGAPSASLASSVGGIVGTVSYRVTFRNAAGETALGAASNDVTGQAFTPPNAPTPSVYSAHGPLVGTYYWAVAFVTARGETTPSGVAGPITALATAPPTAPGLSAGGFGMLVGTRSYRVTNVTALGETLTGPPASRTAPAVASGGGLSPSQLSNTVGNLKWNSQYYWRVTHVTEYGETLPGNASGLTIASTVFTPGAPTVGPLEAGDIPLGTYVWAVAFVTADGRTTAGGSVSTSLTISGSPTAVTLTNIATGPAGVTARRIYRSGSNWPFGGSTPLRHVGDLTDNISTVYTDGASLRGAAMPSAGNINGAVSLSVGTAPGGILQRRLYRTKAGGSSYYLVTEFTTESTLVDTVPDEALTVLAPAIATAGGEKTLVTVPTGPTGTIARRVYRTIASGSEYRLLVELQDNSTTAYLDNTPDAGLTGEGPPLLATAGGQSFIINVPIGPTGTLARRIYRTVANGSPAQLALAGELGNNSTTSWLDAVPDASLGAAPPLVNAAGASAVQVSNIPIGPSSITSRRLYRTAPSTGDLTVWYFVAEIDDNSTTTYLDDRSDKELGDVGPTTSTIGALPGATSLTLFSVAAFRAAGGWALIGNSLVRYTGISGTTLTGIPASGDGALVTAIKAGEEVLAAAMLIGVTGLQTNLLESADVNVLVEVTDTGAAAAIAAVEGGDGIHEHVVSDPALSVAACQSRADAELALYRLVEESLTFLSEDIKLRSGAQVAVSLGPPQSFSGRYLIQRVVLHRFGIPKRLPLRRVTASSYLYTFEHLLHTVLVSRG